MAAPTWMRAEGVTAAVEAGGGPTRRFGWLALGLAAWIFGALIVVSYAYDTGLTNDITWSPYHAPFYLGLLVLLGLTARLVLQARRRGGSWRTAFPTGYGLLGVAAAFFVAWPIVDVGWREGIGVNDAGIELLAAPSRAFLFAGLVLAAAGPLRVALRWPGAGTRWQAALSGALVFAIVGAWGGLAPASNRWMERPLTTFEDNTELWVMDGDGANQTRLLEAVDDVIYGYPTWSPDGTRFAYTQLPRPPRGGPVADIDIWIADADGSNRRAVVTGPGWQWLPHWSPDGEWLSYTVDPPGGPGGGISGPDSGFGQGPAAGPQAPVELAVDVWQVRVDGTGAPERLTDDPGDDRSGVYSPDGRSLLFDSTRDSGSPAVYVLARDGGDVVRATSLGDDWGATWSPDGRSIAFNAWRSEFGGYELFVVPWPGPGEPVRLTMNEDSDVTPSWSPDGTRLAFASTRGGRDEIWSIAADGTDPVNLTRTIGPGEYLAPGGGAWGLDGRIIYMRVEPSAAEQLPIVREDLGVAGVIVQAILAAVVALLVVAAGAPFGAIAIMLGLQTSVAVVGNGDWRFVPAAIVLGLLVDVAIRLAPDRHRPAIAGAGAAVAVVLAPGLTVLATTGLVWTPTLLLGVALTAGAIGWGLSGVVGRVAIAEAGPGGG